MTAGPPARLTRVRVVDLPGLAGRVLKERDRYPVLPITSLRAEAQAANPAAKPDDVGLILAWIEERCVGYLGMFPVRLEGRPGDRRISCLSTYYVAPEHRGSGAGTLLMLDAVSLGIDLFVEGFAEITGRVCRAVGFRALAPIDVLSLRFDLGLVAPAAIARLRDRAEARGAAAAVRRLDAARRLSRASVEALLRPPLVAALRRPGRAGQGRTECAPIPRVVTPAGGRPLRPPGAGPGFARDDATVNWMIEHPWIAEGGDPGLDYAFSSWRPVFRFLPFGLRDARSGRDLGYAVLRVSGDGTRTVVRVLDTVLVDPDLRFAVLDLALREARRHAADRLECGAAFADGLGSNLLIRHLTRREQRSALLFARDAGAYGSGTGPDFAAGFTDGDAPFV